MASDNHHSLTPLKMLFASDGEGGIFLMAGIGDRFTDARNCGHHADDVFTNEMFNDIPKRGGLHVFEGEAYWTEGSPEYPGDMDFLISGSWREPTAQETWKFSSGKEVWPNG